MSAHLSVCRSVTNKFQGVQKFYNITAIQPSACVAVLQRVTVSVLHERSIWKKHLLDVYNVKMIVRHCFVLNSA